MRGIRAPFSTAGVCRVGVLYKHRKTHAALEVQDI